MELLDRTIINIFNLPNLYTSKISTPKMDDLFGVFVTVHRFTRLRDWPEDIHGCIGYWDPQYKTLSSQMIYDKIMTTSKDAMFSDSRRSYFPPIENDPTSRIEISLMKQPLYKITNAGIIEDLGISFDNNKFGLIVDDSRGHRATYLPKVFENVDWKTIKTSVESKAGVNSSSNTSNVYYAYKTKTVDREIFALLFDPVYSDKIQHYPRKMIQLFQQMIDQNLDGSKIPFMIDGKGIITSNQLEVIRNSSVISVYMHNKKRKLNKVLREYFYESLINSQNEQEIANILTLFIEIGEDIEDVENMKGYVSRIYKKIKLYGGDKVFERPQIIIALIKYYSKMGLSSELKKVVNLAMSDFGLITNNLKGELNDVFMLNWYSKLLKDILLVGDKNIYNHAIILMNTFLDIYRSDQNINNKTETNYLAVTFEGMMSLVYILSKLKKREYLNGISLAFKVFLELMKRYDPRMGVFKFLSGESRLDITCHVLNGFLVSL